MDEKTKEGVKKVLAMLVDLQEDAAPIRLSIGYTDPQSKQVQEGLVIYDAPGKVVKALANTGGIITGLHAGGLHLTIFPQDLP